jgi:hypothetical protein
MLVLVISVLWIKIAVFNFCKCANSVKCDKEHMILAGSCMYYIYVRVHLSIPLFTPPHIFRAMPCQDQIII